ncbi:unnamed protein product, partial [Prorocentrum cordatum]
VDWQCDDASSIWWCGFYPAGYVGAESWAIDWKDDESGSWPSQDWDQKQRVQCAGQGPQHQQGGPTQETKALAEQAAAAEVLAAGASRTTTEAHAAVAEARKDRGFFPSKSRPRGGASSKKGKGCLIRGRPDHRWRERPDRRSANDKQVAPKGEGFGSQGGPEGKASFGKNKGQPSQCMGWGIFDLHVIWPMSNLASRELAPDCGATTLGGSRGAVASLVEAAMSEYPRADCRIDGDGGPWFKLAHGEWGQAMSEAWLHSPAGWLGAHVLDADDVPVSTGVGRLSARDVASRSNSLQLYDREGKQAEAAGLRRGRSGRRLLDAPGPLRPRGPTSRGQRAGARDFLGHADGQGPQIPSDGYVSSEIAAAIYEEMTWVEVAGVIFFDLATRATEGNADMIPLATEGFSGNYRSHSHPEVAQQAWGEMAQDDPGPTATLVRHLANERGPSKHKGRVMIELVADATHSRQDGPKRVP